MAPSWNVLVATKHYQEEPCDCRPHASAAQDQPETTDTLPRTPSHTPREPARLLCEDTWAYTIYPDSGEPADSSCVTSLSRPQCSFVPQLSLRPKHVRHLPL